jgi:hypothetical protein
VFKLLNFLFFQLKLLIALNNMIHLKERTHKSEKIVSIGVFLQGKYQMSSTWTVILLYLIKHGLSERFL